MRKILVPTDLSLVADCACNLAQRIGDFLNCDVHLLSVIEAPAPTMMGSEDVMLGATFNIQQEFLKEKDNLEKELAIYANTKGIKSHSVVIGKVDNQILSFSKNENFHLIVMGTSGASGIKEFLNGSHAQKIVRKAGIPVITIKHAKTAISIQKIVFAHDFLNKEHIDIEPLINLAESLGARIHFLQVITPDNFSLERTIKTAMGEFTEKQKLVIKDSYFHLYCDSTIEKGILHFSEDNEMNLVAIASHQRKGINRFFHHSISEAIINHNDQIILTFPIS